MVSMVHGEYGAWCMVHGAWCMVCMVHAVLYLRVSPPLQSVEYGKSCCSLLLKSCCFGSWRTDGLVLDVLKPLEGEDLKPLEGEDLKPLEGEEGHSILVGSAAKMAGRTVP
jgi:hypothetical protein